MKIKQWSGTDDNEIVRKVLEYISDDFNGRLLDVPVGIHPVVVATKVA